MASFTKEVKPRLAKHPLTSLVKEATVGSLLSGYLCLHALVVGMVVRDYQYGPEGSCTFLKYQSRVNTNLSKPQILQVWFQTIRPEFVTNKILQCENQTIRREFTTSFSPTSWLCRYILYLMCPGMVRKTLYHSGLNKYFPIGISTPSKH